MKDIPLEERYSKKIPRKKKSVKDDETTDASSASSSFPPIQFVGDNREIRFEKLDLIDRPKEDGKEKNTDNAHDDGFTSVSVPMEKLSEQNGMPERPAPE